MSILWLYAIHTMREWYGTKILGDASVSFSSYMSSHSKMGGGGGKQGQRHVVIPETGGKHSFLF